MWDDVLVHKNVSGTAQRISLYIVLLVMSVLLIVMIVAVLLVRKCVEMGNVYLEILHVLRHLLLSVIMMACVIIMKAVTALIVPMEMRMIPIIVRTDFVVRGMAHNQRALKLLVVHLV